MILLGNLSRDEIEERLGIAFPEELATYMDNNRQEDVSTPIKPGKWHCFDVPFNLYCGDISTAKLIYKHLQHFASEVKTPLAIMVENRSGSEKAEIINPFKNYFK